MATDSFNGTTTSAAISVQVNSAIAQAYYIHPDQLGTPRMVTASNGSVVWQWDNVDPFGANIPNENPSGAGQFNFNLRFPGQYADRETNTHYNINRDYDPATGRYIQSDPIGLVGGINTYTYVESNPLIYIDFLGLQRGDRWDPRTYLPDYDRAREIAREELGKHHGHNNADDAQRHAEWSCRMEKEIGPFTAWSSGVGHEIDGWLNDKQPWREGLMDLHNNNEGRKAASEGRPINPNNLRINPQSKGGSY